MIVLSTALNTNRTRPKRFPYNTKYCSNSTGSVYNYNANRIQSKLGSSVACKKYVQELVTNVGEGITAGAR